jgi:hypothetical protein
MANAKTFEEYIINVFSYTLKDMASNWCHNYMMEFLDYIFHTLHKHLVNIMGRCKLQWLKSGMSPSPKALYKWKN